MSEGGAGRKPKRRLRQRLSKPTHLLQPLYDTNHLDASYDRYVLFLLLSAGLKKTGHTAKGQHIFLTVQPHISMREIEDLVKKAFVSGARRVSMEYVPVATAVAMKKSTALVVSLGERHTFVSPVIHGQLHSPGILRSAICGHLITHFLQHILLGDTIALPTVRFLKETRAHISNAFKEEEMEQRGQIMNVRTALGTKESVPLHYLVTCGEAYFRPKSIIKHYFGHEAVLELRRRGEATSKAAALLEAGAITPANLIATPLGSTSTPSSSASTLSTTDSAHDLHSRSNRPISTTRGSSRGELVDLVTSNSVHSDPSLNLSDELSRHPSSSSLPPSSASASFMSASSPLPPFCDLDWVNGLHQLILASIALSPPEYHIELLKNIIIEGEGAKFSGLTDRLQLELQKALKRTEAVISVCPSHAAWRGCAILSSTLHSRTVSREEFQESSRSRARALARLYHALTPKNATSLHVNSTYGGGDDGGLGALTDSAGHGATDGSDSAPGSGRIVSPTTGGGHRVVNRFSSNSGNVMDLASAPVRRISGHNLDVEDLSDLRDSTGSAGPGSPPHGAYVASRSLSNPPSSSNSTDLGAASSSMASPSLAEAPVVRRVALGNRRGGGILRSTGGGDNRFGDLLDLRSSDTPTLPELEDEYLLPSSPPNGIACTSSPTLPSSTLPDTALPELVDLAPSASAPSGLSRHSSRRRSGSKPSQKKVESNTPSSSTPSTQPSNGSSSPRSNSTASSNNPAPGSRKVRRGSVKSKRNSAKSDRSMQLEDAAEEVAPKERSPRPSVSKPPKHEDKEKESKESKDLAKESAKGKKEDSKERKNDRSSLREESGPDDSNSTSTSMKRASSLARTGSDSENTMDVDEVTEASDIISESAISSEMVRRYRRHILRRADGDGAEEDDSLSLSLSGSLAFSNSSSISSASISSTSKNQKRRVEPRLRRLSLGLDEIDRSNIERQSSSPSIPADSSPPRRRLASRSSSGGRPKALTGSKKWRSKLGEVEDLATSSSTSSVNATSPPPSTSLRFQPTTGSSNSSATHTNASSSSSPQDTIPPLDVSPASLSPKTPSTVSLDGGSSELPLSGRITGETTFDVPPHSPALDLAQSSGASLSAPIPTKKSKNKDKRSKKRESVSAQDLRILSSSNELPLTRSFNQPLPTAPHLDSPDHIKQRPDLPPKPTLNRTELVIQFVQPMEILLKAYWKWLQDYFTPFIRHQLRDREFLEQYVVPRYQKFIYLKNNVDPETARQIHPDIFIELAWQAHMSRPLHYRAYSTKHFNGRIINHDLLEVRLAHELEKPELDTMQKHWKKLFAGESFLKTTPTAKVIYQEMQTITTPVGSSPAPSTSAGPSSAAPSPVSSDTIVSVATATSSPRSLPSTDYIAAPAYQPSATAPSSTSGNGSAGNIVSGTSSPRLGSTPSVFSSSSGSLPTGSAPNLGNASTAPKPVRGKHKAKNEPQTVTQHVPTVKFLWKPKDSNASTTKPSKMPTLPELDFDLAGAILEDLDNTEACTPSLRKASLGEFSRKNWSHSNTQFALIKSYEMFFYLLLKYGNKYSQAYFRPPPYLAVVARAHMCFPHLYLSDCRKYRGHLVGMGPLSLPPGLTAAQSFEKARKLFIASGLRSGSRLRNKPEDMMKVLSEEEFGGCLENVVRPCPHLPLEVLARIFKKLPTSAADPSFVSRTWCAAFSMPDIWRSHTMHDFPDAMADLPQDTRGFRPFYNEKLREAIGNAVIFDFGAAKVRCGTAKDGLARTTATDSSTRNSDDTSSDSDIDADHGFHSTDYAVSGHGPVDDHFKLAPRYVYQAVVRRAIKQRK